MSNPDGAVSPALTAADAPCAPCAQKKGIRQFSLNTAEHLVDPDAVPQLDEHVLFAVVDGTLVLYQRRLGISHVLNATAAMIWATVGDGLTVREITDAVACALGVDAQDIERDVRITISQFLANEIVAFHFAAEAAPQIGADRPLAERKRRLLVESSPDHVVGPVIAAGAAAVVRTNDFELASALADLLAPLLPAGLEAPTAAASEVLVLDRGTDGERRYRLYVDGTRRGAWSTTDRIPSAVASELNRLATETAGRSLCFHAGAVERDGEVVLIAGGSGRGKSTLTAALVRRGFSYLTDEVVVVEPASLAAMPYPKALALDHWSCTQLDLPTPSTAGDPKANVAPTALGPISTGGRVRLVVELVDEIEVQSEGSKPAGVTKLVTMLGCTFLPSLEDENSLESLAALVERVPVVRLERNTLDQNCAEVVALLDREHAN